MKRVLLLTALFCLMGCSAAATVRTTGYGAPGRLEKGQMEVAGGITSLLSGGPMLGLGLTDWMNLELTSEFAYASWAMGGVAARFTPLRPDQYGKGPALDLELGGGAGAGYYESCIGLFGTTSCYEKDWKDVLSYGAYAGIGFGWWWKGWIALFLRTRAAVYASDYKQTHSPIELICGLEFKFDSGLHLYLDLGGFVSILHEEVTYHWGFIAEGGLSIPFEVF